VGNGRASQMTGAGIRLHVVGCARSGTTLMAELIATCFAGIGHAEHELSIFRPAPAEHRVYVSKKPSDVKRIGPLLRADPDLFVIDVYRDPRAVITSTLGPGHPYRIPFENWAKCIRAARALAGHPRFLDVRYERLVAEPDAVQREIEAWLPFLMQRHPFSQFDRHAQPTSEARSALGGVRAVDAERVARWRAHLPRVKAELLRHPEMATVLIELGYEPDASWTCELDAVAPFDQPRKAGFRRFFRNLDTDLRYLLKQRRYLRALRTRPARYQTA